MAKKDISPSDLQSVDVSPIYLTRNDLHGQKNVSLWTEYKPLVFKVIDLVFLTKKPTK